MSSENIEYLRKNNVIAVVTTQDDGSVTVEHRVYYSISKAKNASRLIGLGKVRNVQTLPEAQG